MSDDYVEERGEEAFSELMARLPTELRWLAAEAVSGARAKGEKAGAEQAARALA